MNPEQLKKGKAKMLLLGKDEVADYKDVDSLKRYLSERGKIYHAVLQVYVQNTKGKLQDALKEHV